MMSIRRYNRRLFADLCAACRPGNLFAENLQYCAKNKCVYTVVLCVWYRSWSNLKSCLKVAHGVRPSEKEKFIGGSIVIPSHPLSETDIWITSQDISPLFHAGYFKFFHCFVPQLKETKSKLKEETTLHYNDEEAQVQMRFRRIMVRKVMQWW